jgi:hypothetical protein
MFAIQDRVINTRNYKKVLEICKLQSSYMFKVALVTTVCYDKSCINYKNLEIKIC